jgi:GntR family transcriptional regulator, transcriptional repressor for pyruvate dehydrogenase complex
VPSSSRRVTRLHSRDLVPLERRRATADAAAAVQEQIRAGRYGPGERLPSERELSELLSVSRPTVREALQALAALNIVEMRHGSGTYVSSLELEELLQPLGFALEVGTSAVVHLFELRLAIEPFAASLAAERATDEELVRIRTLVEGSSPETLTREELIQIDSEFHTLIVEAARNPLLIALHRSLGPIERQSRELTSRSPSAAKRAIAEHRRLLEALERRDPVAATLAMQQHLTRVREAAEITR